MSPPELPLIQSLWIGGSLSAMEQLSIKSFLANGHPYHLYTYGEVKGVPDGALVKNGEEILPRDRIFVYKKEKSYAGFSNLFRYKMLLDHGGFWVDTDVVCLRPYRFNHELVIGRGKNLNPDFDRKWICGSGVIGAVPGSEFIRRCFEVADGADSESLVWGQTGPQLVTRFIHEMGLLNQTQPERIFGCIRSNKWYRSIHPKASISRLLWNLFRLKGAYSLHFYNEMWRRNGQDKNLVYPAHTVYERLKRRYSEL